MRDERWEWHLDMQRPPGGLFVCEMFHVSLSSHHRCWCMSHLHISCIRECGGVRVCECVCAHVRGLCVSTDLGDLGVFLVLVLNVFYSLCVHKKIKFCLNLIICDIF